MFFIWVLLSSIPALLMARFVIRRAEAPAPADVPAAVA
jgi:hypothetical protein